MFSHSTPIIPRGSFQVECEKIWGSFGVGDHFGSCLGRFWGSFEVGDYLGSGIISGRVHLYTYHGFSDLFCGVMQILDQPPCTNI